MTLPEIVERVSSGPTGGYITIDSRLDNGYMTNLIHSARAFIVCERWKQFGMIPPVYYQKYEPDYSKLAQDDEGCYTVFYGTPQIIALDGRASGIGYVGAINDIKCQFREVSTLGELASFQNDRIMKTGRKAYILNGQGTLTVWYKTKIKQFMMEIIAADPTKLPSYNVDFDDYPMDISDIPKMESYMLQGSFGLVYKTPIDRINDGRDITVPPQVRS
jgi:hypothetical protein